MQVNLVRKRNLEVRKDLKDQKKEFLEKKTDAI